MLEGTAVKRRLSWGAIYLWAVGVTGAVERLWPCPEPCQCNREVLEVNCSECQLTTVPNGFPEDSQLLNLTHNNIKTVVQQQFKTLTHLWDLDLSDNILVMIEVEAFLGLQSLLTLRLARNRLKFIPVGAFAGLPKLQLLDISENEILVFLDFTFRDLQSLQCMEAGENDLVFISHHAFSGLTSLHDLHLDSCNLTAVPTEALTQLSGLISLRFHHLGLTMLPNYSFRRLGRLKKLVISYSSWLEALAGNSLFGLNLTSLTISNCNLSAVPYAALHHLVYLIYLDLSFNPITHIQGNHLGDLLRLREFHLVMGRLLHVEPGAFHGLTHFSLLNASGNLLTTLEEGAFHSVSNLEVLRLDNNPLACDCRLLWVVRRRLYLDFDGRPPICTTSVQLQGWNFLDFSNAELPGLFTCRQARILNRKPQEIRVDEGQTVLFYCNADGDPAPSISWLNPKYVDISTIGRIRVLANNSLEVRYAQVQDSGTYLCVASNAAGNDSVPVSLHVHGFPSSSRKPFHLESWFPFPSGSPAQNGTQQLSFDVKTLLIAVTIGFLSFFSSVTICFIFMFVWSKSKGKLKRTATIAYVPRSATKNNGGTGNYMEPGRLTMKLI
ncbi:leucine-rich repeat and immunoglobulin-like domain-containing nogo receptor-interacting protein 1 [Lampris incognitus]|uniref:leucine-rich repeat and immunoglobulin-like domain-containing nogo receptor-interacting protein 1 n=1 Tax=Lampris incognitus TaxID=2546036 RepID=UPI0024B4B28F|nr:leucine-rich repeat and immunoglobulin-like domain-containing nogo receptor-interacting protein 1 [Lampris incognitus]